MNSLGVAAGYLVELVQSGQVRYGTEASKRGILWGFRGNTGESISAIHRSLVASFRWRGRCYELPDTPK